jgi:hypothetical protein
MAVKVQRKNLDSPSRNGKTEGRTAAKSERI